jgi:Thymidylate kinase
MGKLIAFEGIDHVGKTTLVDLIYQKLVLEGLKCVTFSFPGKEPRSLGALVYDIHHNTNKYFDDLTMESLQLLHIAAHIDCLKQKIIPYIKEGYIVLLDRCWWSTFAYGKANGIDEGFLSSILLPERYLFDSITNKKIFYISRNNIEIDYNISIHEQILHNYDGLLQMDRMASKFENDSSLDIAVEKLYYEVKKIL